MLGECTMWSPPSYREIARPPRLPLARCLHLWCGTGGREPACPGRTVQGTGCPCGAGPLARTAGAGWLRHAGQGTRGPGERGWMKVERLKLKVVFGRFQDLYNARYDRTPPAPIAGLVMSILAGEVQVLADEPEYSPLREVVPLLREAREAAE